MTQGSPMVRLWSEGCDTGHRGKRILRAGGWQGWDVAARSLYCRPGVPRIRLDRGHRRRIFQTMDTIVKCRGAAEYKRTETKFLVLHTGHAACKVCGATLESWLGTP